MPKQISQIKLTNFKAFNGDFDLNLSGRSFLGYGANGSGKSSFYWALYTFLQSSMKQQDDVVKYFDQGRKENLVNIFCGQPDDAAISITLTEIATGHAEKLTISKKQHETDTPEIKKINLASDFVTYRALFDFYNFTNSESVDLWPVFEKEILHFCVSPLGINLYEAWIYLRDNDPQKENKTKGLRGRHAKTTYDKFGTECQDLSVALELLLSDINPLAQKIYNKHFKDDDIAISFSLKLTRPLEYLFSKRHFVIPSIGLDISVDRSSIHRPQSFLNESKLTQIALSIRLAASKAMLHDSELALLVIDDLLISLDMDNRMTVADIILTDFKDHQKIILTHDMGFFREFKRCIDEDENWFFGKFFGTAKGGIKIECQKDDIEKAKSYIAGHDLEEAAVCLRRAAENTARAYREWAEKKRIRPGEFHTLTEHLKAVRGQMEKKIPLKFYDKVVNGIPEGCIDKLFPQDDSDLETDSTLSAQHKGILKTQRSRLKQLLSVEHREAIGTIELIDKVIRMKDRVLNPAAHDGSPPLYQKEVEKALRLIERLHTVLNKHKMKEGN